MKIKDLVEYKKCIEKALEEEYRLDLKIKKFLNWCFKNKIKNRYTDIGEFQNRNKYMDFIEKMAVWYEMRYPDTEVYKLFGAQVREDVNKEIFDNNPYIQEHFSDSSRLRTIDWKEFYNFDAFLATLSPIEKSYLKTPEYANLIYIDKDIYVSSHLHLSTDGYVTDIEFNKFLEDTYNLEQLIGKHIKDVLKILYELKIIQSKDNPIEIVIKEYENDYYFINELLNCVMYRIIDRGGNRIGPRRALLFAKEFYRNIEIPLMYGIDMSDPDLYLLIIEYLKLGGRKDLDCYQNYFSLKNKWEKLEVVNLKEIIDLELSNLIEKGYEEEFITLHKLVNNEQQLIKKKEFKN